MILTNFGSISPNLGNIFQSPGVHTNSWWPWFKVKWTQQNFLNFYFLASRPKYSSSSLYESKSSRDRLTRIVILTKFGSISPNLGDIFQWIEHSNTFWTLIFELLGWNIAPLHFKTERVGGTALRASWLWSTSARFARILAIFSSPGDSKLTPDGLGLQWNGSRKTFSTLNFKLLGRNTTVIHFKTEIVAETALRASWFWPSSARFPGTWGIFSSPGDFTLTPDGLGLQLNAQSVTF